MFPPEKIITLIGRFVGPAEFSLPMHFTKFPFPFILASIRKYYFAFSVGHKPIFIDFSCVHSAIWVFYYVFIFLFIDEYSGNQDLLVSVDVFNLFQ